MHYKPLAHMCSLVNLAITPLNLSSTGWPTLLSLPTVCCRLSAPPKNFAGHQHSIYGYRVELLYDSRNQTDVVYIRMLIYYLWAHGCAEFKTQKR